MNRILESKLNSVKRSPELSVSLPMGRSTGRVVGWELSFTENLS
ncbi:hypothetical protein [Leptospira noguchii]|nr:hypothetical protein [Leptospira noguchii]